MSIPFKQAYSRCIATSRLSHQNVNSKLVCIKSSDIEPRTILYPEPSQIPNLKHGLDRVLFNSGVHVLHDSRTNVYNFEPSLRKIHHPSNLDFSRLPSFIPASRDNFLIELGKKSTTNSTFLSSTSSISSAMCIIYFMISKLKPLNLDHCISMLFAEEPRFFTYISREPVSFVLRPHGSHNLRSIVIHKSIDETPSILSKLGQSLERYLTFDKEEFLQLLNLTAKVNFSQKQDLYTYMKAGSFILRSQLDCYDDRLPKGAFDLKTRATLPIRMDVSNYMKYLGYRITSTFGITGSYEREFFDLCRSSLLKYSFQMRIGNMDGIFIAYHNTDEIFGFQYLNHEEIDKILFGSCEIGDVAYKNILLILENLFETIIEHSSQIDNISDKNLRVTFSLQKDVSKLSVFVEAQSVNDLDLFEVISQYTITTESLINNFPVNFASVENLQNKLWTVNLVITKEHVTNKTAFDTARYKADKKSSFWALKSSKKIINNT